MKEGTTDVFNGWSWTSKVRMRYLEVNEEVVD